MMIEVLYHDEVMKFIKKLKKPTRSKILQNIELLENYGRNLTLPHAKKIIGELFELRIRGNQEVRIFYFIRKNKAFLIHGFLKKSQKTPQNEIETARKRVQLLT